MGPYVIDCLNCGKVEISTEEYMKQLGEADRRWKCTVCGESGWFDDVNYQDWLDRNFRKPQEN